MLVFNQKIIVQINNQVSKGEAVVVKLKADTKQTENKVKHKTKKTVDSVTSGSFETKMHFAQAQIISQNASIKENK